MTDSLSPDELPLNGRGARDVTHGDGVDGACMKFSSNDRHSLPLFESPELVRRELCAAVCGTPDRAGPLRRSRRRRRDLLRRTSETARRDRLRSRPSPLVPTSAPALTARSRWVTRNSLISWAATNPAGEDSQAIGAAASLAGKPHASPAMRGKALDWSRQGEAQRQQ